MPLYTTTHGVGQLIRDALDQGCRDFIIGIGGSATNDGGTGMAQALGVRFLDQNRNEITAPMTGAYMGRGFGIGGNDLVRMRRQHLAKPFQFGRGLNLGFRVVMSVSSLDF